VGDACGAKTVDQQLVSMIEKNYANNIDAFRTKYPDEYVCFLWEIECMKENYDSNENQELEISVPDNLSQTGKAERVTISKAEFKQFLDPVLKSIDRLIVEIEKQKHGTKLSHLILAGGFSNDTLIQDHIEEKYKSKYTIIAPFNPAVAVLEGAVLYGQRNNKDSPLITERVCKSTLGFAVFQNFDKTHKEEKKIIRKGIQQAKDCFKVVFRKGETVKTGSYKEIPVYDEFIKDRVAKKREPVVIKLYSSEEDTPKYTDGCQNLCEMKMFPPNGEWPEEVIGKVRFEVAGTELQGSLYDDFHQIQDRCKFEYFI
jgi:hypothetical protein